MTGQVADLDDHDTKVKELQQRRKANANQTLLNETMTSMTTANFDPSETPSIRGTEVGEELIPAKKRAKDKEEYERRKQEEEEMKKIIADERQKQLDQYGGVDDNMQAIPIEKILQYKMKQKMQNNQDMLSNTMTSQNLYGPAISGNTLMTTNNTNQLAGGS